MKIFLLEYITAGGFNKQVLPKALLQEGVLMRDALLRDFSMLDGIEIVTTYDARLPKPNVAKAQRIANDEAPFAVWRKLLDECDAALIVAPETEHILTELTQMLENSTVYNLGCHSSAVALASNKLDTFKALKNAGILTIETCMLNDAEALFYEQDSSGFVVKPIDGAGCENTFYFKNLLTLKSWLANGVESHLLEKMIIQPYIAGQAASISALFKNGYAWVLSCNAQQVLIPMAQTKDVSMQYTGSVVNGLSELPVAFKLLANQIALALPNLNGYVGIDLITQHNEIYVVEINPRITTSYIGLHESLNLNPAALILNLSQDDSFELPKNMTKKPVNIHLHA